MLKGRRLSNLHVLRTDMDFLEAGWIGAGGSPESTDNKFNMFLRRTKPLRFRVAAVGFFTTSSPSFRF